MAAINLVGIGANWALPGVYVELDFAQGPAGGSGTPKTCILIGNALSGAVATTGTVIYGPDTAVTCQTENDVITLFGAGSQLHRMFLRFTATNKVTALYFIAVAVSGGAAATNAMTLATTATSNGNLRYWWADQFVDTPITSGQTAIQIATNVVASINSQTRWGITAANSGTAVVTVTANNTGLEGNWQKVQSQITPGTATIGTTTSLTANTLLSSGTTADVYTTALSTIQPGTYYYIVSADSDATNVGKINTQVLSNAQPTNGIFSRCVFGSADTLANTITVCTGLNSPRAECIWNGSTAVDLPPLECAALMAGIYMLLEIGSQYGVYRKNFSNFPASPTDVASWPVIPGRAGLGGAPTSANLQSALNNGITPISVTQQGASAAAYLVKRVTTRSLSSGTLSDYRIRDSHRVSVCDYWCFDVKSVLSQGFGGKDLLPDPVQGQPPPGPNATTPRLVGNAVKTLTSQYGGAGQWSYPPGIPLPTATATPADVINANTIVQPEPSSPNRVSILAPLSVVNILDVTAVLAQQVG
jgi:phage tail sheath gpL-like